MVVALYGTTGLLEAARRALNVVFGLEGGRSFLRRKTIDVLFTIVLMALVLVSLIMVFVGGRFARDLLGFAGLGPTAADIWNFVRWPGAVLVAMLVFALHLLRHAGRGAPRLPLAHPGRRGRGAALAAGVGGLLASTSRGSRTWAPSTAPSPARSC